MAKSSNQTMLGKAFEYACVMALFEKYRDVQEICIDDTPQMDTARNCYQNAGDKQGDLSDGAAAAVRVIDRLEPRLQYPDKDVPLILSV